MKNLFEVHTKRDNFMLVPFHFGAALFSRIRDLERPQHHSGGDERKQEDSGKGFCGRDKQLHQLITTSRAKESGSFVTVVYFHGVFLFQYPKGERTVVVRISECISFLFPGEAGKYTPLDL